MIKMTTTVFISSIVSAVFGMTTRDPMLDELNRQLEWDFKEADLNHNGLMELEEMEQRVERQDYDKDGCVSFPEYMRARIHDSLKFAWATFRHFDHNDDDCLEIEDLIEEFHIIDINPKDGEVTIQELEAYYDKLFEHISLLLDPAMG